jgi:hypothetical protein
MDQEARVAMFRRKQVGEPVGKPGEWYYCLKHRTAEEGPQCPSKQRMGPYQSRVEAEHAMQIVAERNEEWDAGGPGAEPGPASGGEQR